MKIQEITFGPKRYLTLKKSISTDQITDKQMYDDAGKKLGTYMGQHGLRPSGSWSVLYFMWDDVNKKAEIGISFPIDNLDSVDDPELTMVDIPQSKTVMTILQGSYEGLADVHQSLSKHITENKHNTNNLPVTAIEEYIIDPMSEPNPQNWITNIYYFYN